MRIEARAKHEPISHVAVLSGTSLAPGIIEATPALHASLRYQLRKSMAALNMLVGKMRIWIMHNARITPCVCWHSN
jgi:hypothetical protein